MKIKTIEVENYRAFYGKKTINLEQENLLVYGENGSGKSSFYQAFSDFFCVTDEANDVKFEVNKWNSLSQTPLPSSISFIFDNDQKYTYTPTEPTTQEVPVFQEVGKQKPFYTYRRLLRTYLVDKGEIEKNIFRLLIEDILSNYVDANGFSFNNTWEQFKKLATKRGRLNWQDRAIQDRLENFNIEFSANVNSLVTKTNEYLRTYFNNGIELTINTPTFESNAVYVNDLRREVKEQIRNASVNIQLKLFNQHIDDYHYFLNEARLSALSLCLYLSSLKVIPSPENLKVLFLDDIFIGLDTSNRIPLLKILESADFENWQVIITSYDRQWYELAKNYLSSWRCTEMFVGRDESNSFDIPVVIEENLNAIEKAKEYFNAFDYYSAGNNIRKAIEQKLYQLIPEQFLIGTKDLEGMIKVLFKFYEECDCSDLITVALKRELLTFKDIILNPSSHYDIKSPIYRIEVEKAFNVYNLLDVLPEIKRTILCNIGEKLVYKNEGKNYEAHYLLMENIYKIEIEGYDNRLTDANHKSVYFTYNGTRFAKMDGEAYTEEEVFNLTNSKIKLSIRPARIKHYLSLDQEINWKEEFVNIEGKSLNDLLNSENI